MRRLFVPAFITLVLALSASDALSRWPSAQDVNSPIDLVQVQLVVPRKVTIGKLFRVMDEVENQGRAVAFQSITGFFLSEDPEPDSQDIGIGGRRVPQLGPGQAHSMTTPVTLKGTIKPGDYFFLAVADAR